MSDTKVITKVEKDLRKILPKKKRRLVKLNKYLYYCFFCGASDERKQSVLRWDGVTLLNCGVCKTKMVISVVKEGVLER